MIMQPYARPNKITRITINITVDMEDLEVVDALKEFSDQMIGKTHRGATWAYVPEDQGEYIP